MYNATEMNVIYRQQHRKGQLLQIEKLVPIQQHFPRRFQLEAMNVFFGGNHLLTSGHCMKKNPANFDFAFRLVVFSGKLSDQK